MKNLSFSFLILLISPALLAGEIIQYFSGQVQISSLDESVKRGPPYPSITKRIIAADKKTITECVLQRGQVFLAFIRQTKNPRIYFAEDSNKSFTGYLMFNDDFLNEWSYDIDVTQPSAGKLLGQRPQYGAFISPLTGEMLIRKIFNDSMLFTESYKLISAYEYQQLISQLSAVPAICQ